MASYVIGTVEVTDPKPLERYVERVPAIVARYGGTFLAAGPVAAMWEGERRPTTGAVIAFESTRDATRWYESEEYRAIRDLRLRSGPTSVVLLGGLG